MDSKYSMMGNNRPTLPKFQIKSKPAPIVFTTGSSPKKLRLSENEDKSNSPRNRSPVHNSNLQSQRKNLPIYNVRNRLLEEISKHQTLIIIGETGSGKTTQIPQFLLSARLQNEGVIGITQPRRIAAITIALRVAQEVGTQIGETVGYTVRFEDVTKPRTKIKYLTDGMLLRESMTDSQLLKYSVIILDEAHERTVHTDVLFGVVKNAQRTRKERNLSPLKVLIMSATMDVDHYSEYFNCQTIYVEGRNFPIDVYHAVKPQEDYQFSCLTALFKLHREAPVKQDFLVFLTGQEEIEAMTNRIYSILKDPDSSTLPMIRVYPLYASLPSEKQLEVFKPIPENVRKVILSTNIAETSVTITGVHYVIDSGMVKARTYHPSTGLDYLKVQRVSKAQAWQRTGRAGREAQGYCYRMYTKSEFDRMKETTTPEIQRCNLSNVCLQLLALNIHAMKFDFMDKPDNESIEKAFLELKYLGALESINTGQLSSLGKNMVKFPLDPRFSKVLLSAKDYNCVEEVLTIVSILSSESILVTPSKKREQAIAARQKFNSPFGDHLTLLNIYRGFNNAGQKSKFCYENFLNFRNLLYAKEVRDQLVAICQNCNIPMSSCGNNVDQVRKCLITGLFLNIAELQRNIANGVQLMTLETKQVVAIHPSSVLHGLHPHCVLFTEVVHTTKCYLRYITTIEPSWLHDVVPEYMQTHKLTSVATDK